MLDLRKQGKCRAAQGALSVTERAPPDGAGNAATRGLTGNEVPAMSHPAPWQLLIHDPGRGDSDPKFILCTVASPGDVRPAEPGIRAAGADLSPVDAVTVRWVAARHGVASIELAPLPHAAVWRVDEGGKPR
jgi:hypothetical protein